MLTRPQQKSNPFSTGSGGANFETRLQAAFTVLLLTGRLSPCLPPWPITKLKVQGSHAGFKTDDFIVYTRDPNSRNEGKLLAQIKHAITISENDEVFQKVITAAWHDFSESTVFSPGTDAIALITGPLSARDINNTRTLFEWARHSEDETEFLAKVNAKHFSSEAKKGKLQTFRASLNVANEGVEVTEKQLWEFLKSYHLLGYDLDGQDGTTLSLVQSLISQASSESPTALWSQILDAVQSANQNAGTITRETLPREIRESFESRQYDQWDSDLRKLKDHGEYILNGIKTTIGGVHIERSELLAQLLEASEESGFVFITGGRGFGKSGLVREFFNHVNGRSPVFCIRTEDLDKPHLDNVFSAFGLQSSIRDLESGLALMPKKYLLLESFEKLLELQNLSAFTDLLQFLKAHPSWTVIATGRDYAYQQIVFNYLEPAGLSYTPLTVNSFTDIEVHNICEKLEPLRVIATNSSLKPLLHDPFLADLAFRVSEAGTEFSLDQGEKEFRIAVWRDVIAKERVRIGGMPLRRRKTFVDMAVVRSKQMVYGVPEKDFDAEAVLKLEEDDLVRRSEGLISPAHDVFEDWALEQYIEETYAASDDVTVFLETIGSEPAMNRAFRLWLNQKLRFGDDVKVLILEILGNPNIQRYWQDETISAVLLSDNPFGFLTELGNRLFDNDSELLKRFCFVLRISCKTPDHDLIQRLDAERSGTTHLFLIPYGPGWSGIIHFLSENREFLTSDLTSHVTAILYEWSCAIHLDEKVSETTREAGLLALWMLARLMNSYRDESRKTILAVIVNTVSTIKTEFEELLNTDVFGVNRNDRANYVDSFCKMLLAAPETASLCKHLPDTLIKLALNEFIDDDLDEEQNDRYSYRHLEVEECFGLHPFKHEFFPPSGSKGPFQHLLRFHPRKGLDFILQFLNITGAKYAHSELDSGEKSNAQHGQALSGAQIEILLDDRTSVKQYCSPRLWSAYRSHSVAPDLLESALMALENWLISLAEHSSSKETLEWVFDYILRNSTSVMPTAVLASLATGFPDILGRASLPLLRTPALYELDMPRALHERGGSEIDWFAASLRPDPFAEVYMAERRKSALHPWRQEHLETLVTRLQFTDLREEILVVIDELRSKAPDTEYWRFRFHRIDSRGWEPIEDRDNNRIVFQLKEIEPDLEKIQKRSQEDLALHERFLRMSLWAGKIFDRRLADHEYYSDWIEALEEAKALGQIISSKTEVYISSMYSRDLVKAAAAIVRDYSNELSVDDADWCVEKVIQVFLPKDDSDAAFSWQDSDFDGTTSAASIIPVLLDLAGSEDEIVSVRKLLVFSITHADPKVRKAAAEGIRNHLWARDPEFAQNCVFGAIDYACQQAIISERSRPAAAFIDENEKERDVWMIDFRERLLNGEISLTTRDIKNIQFETHGPCYIVNAVLMIPDGSTDPLHTVLFCRMLNLFSEVREDQFDQIHKYSHIRYELQPAFTRRFAEYLFELRVSGSQLFEGQLRETCDSAPELIKDLLLSVALASEKNRRKELYWSFWKILSEKVQDIAINASSQQSLRDSEDPKRKLIRGMLKADMPWQKIDYENQEIALGKDLILEFAVNAGKNIDVFDSLSSLMYHFPKIFFRDGVHILARHQAEAGGTHLLSGLNTAFYLERSILTFLQVDETGPLTKSMHHSCFTLLDALVENASSRAYYLREQLIRSRRIL